MKRFTLVSLVLFTAFSASADDACVTSIYRLHDTLTSKSAFQTMAAFSSVMLADSLSQKGLTKGYFDAYVKSAERKQMGDEFQGALQASLKACSKKPQACQIAMTTFYNSANEPSNRYAKALAVNELVKQMDAGELFVVSQKNLADELSDLSTKISASLGEATKACK